MKKKLIENKGMVFQNGVKSIQAAACNGAHGIRQQIFILFNSLDKAFRNIIDHNAYNFRSNDYSIIFLQKLNFDDFLQTSDFFVLFVDFNLSLAMD